MSKDELIKYIKDKNNGGVVGVFDVYEIDEQDYLEMREIDENDYELYLPDGVEQVVNTIEHHMSQFAMYGEHHYGIKYKNIYLKVEMKWSN